ncbi:MAG: 2-hydroxyacid dehydrogenase [Anaerolineae bacterium]|nr:2-hydroxyacid dehydrogenase [Anaerolineae bacterium]
MSLHVFLLHRPRGESALEELTARLDPEVTLSLGPELPDPPDYKVMVAGRPERAHVEASPKLRAVVVPWAGIPDTTRQLMHDFPHIALHNLHHNALPVAEHALALLLAAAKFIVPMDRALRSNDWRPRYQPNPSILLEGRTALILGYGAIGQKLGQLCRGLGMEVLGVRRKAPPADAGGSDRVRLFGIEALHRLLPRADALLVCLPHTPETTGLVGARELALLPRQAVLVNVGRGPVVDEEALFSALREGRLHAAGLDVWYQYPEDEAARANTPPASHPFHELPNVVMSPHRAGGSTWTEHLRMVHLARLLNAAARGEPMPNRVDLDAGY